MHRKKKYHNGKGSTKKEHIAKLNGYDGKNTHIHTQINVQIYTCEYNKYGSLP